jgi:hypothetical protein
MTEGRRQVLAMLAAGRLTAEEADRLLTALETPEHPPTALEIAPSRPARPRYLRVQIDMHEDQEGPINVNLRVPLQLLRAGVKVASLIPPRAQDQVNRVLRQRGLPFDLNQVRPENLDQLIDQLSTFTVAVDQKQNDLKIKVFCE